MTGNKYWQLFVLKDRLIPLLFQKKMVQRPSLNNPSLPGKHCSENSLACKEKLTTLPTPLLCLREFILGLAAEILPAHFPFHSDY